MRIFAISDVHTDYQQNLEWIKALSSSNYKDDVIIVAGDVSQQITLLKSTLTILKSKFKYVFYCTGNHDVWVRDQNTEYTSIDKFNDIMKLCEELEVYTHPKLIENTIWIIPLYAWYEPNFRSEDGDIYLKELKGCELNGWSDFMLCKWPSSILDGKTLPKLNGESLELKCHLKASCEINDYFINYNKQFLPTDFENKPIISFSHFLPHFDLLPPTEFLHFKHLSHVSGSMKLFEIIKEIKPMIHIFGHSHINYNKTIDGIQFIQSPLKYPTERKRWGEVDFQLRQIHSVDIV